MARPCCGRSFKTRELGVLMKAKPMRMLWMVPAGWLNDLPGAASRPFDALPEHHKTHGTNKFTLLDDAVRGIGGAAAGRRIDETGWRQRLVRVHHPSGECRHLFGVGEGPAEAIAGAKQGRMGARPEFCVNFVSVATGKSRQAPLVTQLYTTCIPRL